MTEQPSLNSPIHSGESVERTHISIAEADANFIRLLYPRNNTLANVVNTLLRRFNKELQKYGITDFTRRDDFFRAVANCTIDISAALTDASGFGPPLVAPNKGTTVSVDHRAVEETSSILERTPSHHSSVKGISGVRTSRRRNSPASAGAKSQKAHPNAETSVV
jgi:hypothetical protein